MISKFHQGEGHLKVKVISRSKSFKVKVILDQGHSRSMSFKFKVSQVHSRSKSSHGQGHLKVRHFEVKVILESNGYVFQFLSRSGRLAFIRMLIVTCFLNVSMPQIFLMIQSLNPCGKFCP